MIDFIRCRSALLENNFCILDDNIRVGGITLFPIISKRTGDIEKYEREEKLLFSLKESTLSISNSLHNFHHETNHNDFTAREIQSSIYCLEALTKVQPSWLKISRLEFAVNIVVDKPAMEYIKYLRNYKMKKNTDMFQAGKTYGTKFFLTDYNVKVYDKSEMVRLRNKVELEEHILRIEIEYKRNRILQCSGVSNLQDLTEKANLESLFKDFWEKISHLDWVDESEVINLTCRERELYYAAKNDIFWEYEKLANYETYRKKRVRYRKLMSKVQSTNVSEYINGLVLSKFNQLIDS